MKAFVDWFRAANLAVLVGLASSCAPAPSAKFVEQLNGCRMYMIKPMGNGIQLVSLMGCVVEDELDVPEYGKISRFAVLQAYTKDDGTGNHRFERPSVIQFDAERERLPERIRQRVEGGGYSSRVPVKVLLPWAGVTVVEGEAFEVLSPDEHLPTKSNAGARPTAEPPTPIVTWCKTVPKTVHFGVRLGGEKEESGPRIFSKECGPLTVNGSIRARDGSIPSVKDVVLVPIAADGQLRLKFTADGIDAPHGTLGSDGTFSLSVETDSQDVDKPYALAVVVPPVQVLERDGQPFVFRLRDGPIVNLGSFVLPAPAEPATTSGTAPVPTP